eukprot:Platyproteum_vivax@DN4735_c0_g1_i1.p1
MLDLEDYLSSVPVQNSPSVSVPVPVLIPKSAEIEKHEEQVAKSGECEVKVKKPSESVTPEPIRKATHNTASEASAEPAPPTPVHFLATLTGHSPKKTVLKPAPKWDSKNCISMYGDGSSSAKASAGTSYLPAGPSLQPRPMSRFLVAGGVVDTQQEKEKKRHRVPHHRNLSVIPEKELK